ncbi:molybdopterin converting factor subunit 1 [Azospirillum sp. A1-3]|uniref:Molybdopterin synthase sulfur carrier subunit n=1 Tax=Azospirillum oryzae TaxID=286727 RepID=A0A6N1ASA1_9PROT|nr:MULTISPECIES: molybdopterin converting factor subunit 1 [Azospirillum]KAA0576776.1 molybdopterin converting factor subunit 1 [Azospirillum sp. Sh1]KAA0590798.1 molybdopterin converting factor subunit 1 [Azospirillum oryzae]MCM8733710.1 molybdopterin converting factor subunit 1 [Azospirillum sp. A1-3]QKS52084.1 molybdopterin converting factor subunit 1 [Azospirillum oryzae]GLR77873.1 molybdopterin synthase sulfur carrier subunit [Azospirillum oryzae]
MKILYFAWLRSKIGVPTETVELPAEVTTAGALVEWLKTRSPRHAEALANSKVVKVAVNQEHVPYDHPISATDEIALFPPVTGG